MQADFGVYVISLPGATARRAWMSAHLASRGIHPWSFVDGVDGRALGEAEVRERYDDQKGCLRAGRSFTRGEIGCALSHVKTCRLVAEAAQPWSLVLEDDARLAEDVQELLEPAAAWLSVDEPRVLLLSPLTAFLRRPAIPLAGRYRRVAVHRAWNAHGYALNRAAAALIAAENHPVHLMADDWVGYRRACRGLVINGIDPYAIGTASVAADSQLEGDRAKQRKTGRKRTLRHRLMQGRERLLRHLLEALWYRPFFGIGRHDSGLHAGKTGPDVRRQ